MDKITDIPVTVAITFEQPGNSIGRMVRNILPSSCPRMSGVKGASYLSKINGEKFLEWHHTTKIFLFFFFVRILESGSLFSRCCFWLMESEPVACKSCSQACQ